MDTLGQEIHQAVRRLWRAPAFTAASVLTLALAIGANAAIFGVVERVIINPLPYPDSDRLIDLDHGSVTLKVQSGMGNTSGIVFMYKSRGQSMESVALHSSADRTMSGSGDPERLRVTATTPSLTTVLRVLPAAGRWFTESEGQPGGHQVAVISDELWSRRFGRNPSAIGSTLSLDGQALEIVGVMPASFAFPDARVAMWVPSQLTAASGFGLFGQAAVARLRDGVSIESARAEFNGLLPGIADAYPDDPRAAGNLQTKLIFTGRTLKEATLGNITRGLWLLMGAVATLLLVACANVANLFLVRAEVRQRDVAIRRALGAARLGLARYFYTESALLAMTGGALGLLLAWMSLRLVVAAAPPAMPRLHEVRLDAITVGYVALLSTITAAVFGSIPMWRLPANAALHDSGRGNTTTRRRNHVRYVLLGAQVAMALVLLVGAALMARTFQNLRAIDPGFNADSTLAFSIGLPLTRYGDVATMVATHHTIIDRLAALPGVASVSATTCLPLTTGCNANTMLVEGETYPPGTLPPFSLYRAVAGGYFETMGMRVLRGRGIDRGDVERGEPNAVISQALAARSFKDRDPIGSRIASNQPPPRPGAPRPLRWLTIVGVVADTPMRTLTEAPMPMVFMPMSMGSDGREGRIDPSPARLNYVMRTHGDPLSAAPAVREAVRSVDGELAIAQVTTLAAMRERSSAQLTFTMILLAIAASVALVLGIIGIYGVTSYIVTQRTSEIGVRLALGAAPAGITGQIVKQGGLVALAGIAVGLLGAFAGSRLLASVLYGVSPRDPIVFATMAILLQLVALLACWIPARRAAQLSPTIALRAD